MWVRSGDSAPPRCQRFVRRWRRPPLPEETASVRPHRHHADTARSGAVLLTGATPWHHGVGLLTVAHSRGKWRTSSYSRTLHFAFPRTGMPMPSWYSQAGPCVSCRKPLGTWEHTMLRSAAKQGAVAWMAFLPPGTSLSFWSLPARFRAEETTPDGAFFR